MRVEQKEVEMICKKLKKKKAQDAEGWKNELMIHGGSEMIISLTIMCNKVLREEDIPEEWSRVIIKSVYKNKGPQLEMVNRRGLFLTNLVSKLFEKILYTKSEGSMKVPECQNGGKKGRSAIDNIIIIMSIMDNNRRLGQRTYLIFADAEKCFDKLWLQDCLIDMYEIGMREKEISIIYKMNQITRVTVNTPMGITNEFEVCEVVKQGTIFAPTLCCSNTGKINQLKPQTSTIITPDVIVQAIVYVDDIAGGGDKEVPQGITENLNIMEEEKGYTFGTKKTNYMIARTGREKEQELDLEVRRGKIGRVKEYTYMGVTITESGTVEKHLEKQRNKGFGMVKDLQKMGSQYHVGEMSTVVQLMLFEKTIIPSLTYNLDGISYWRKSDWEYIEQTQSKLLKQILKLPDSTPYWGILNEVGMWPMRIFIHYKKLMLYQNIMMSDDE